MEKKSSKVLLGCGIVFGIFVVLIVLIGFGIYTYVKSASEKQEEIVRLNNFIEEKYGKVEDFIPPKGNIVDSTKFVLFLNVRDSLTKYDDEISADIGTISSKFKGKKEDISFWETMKLMKKGLDIIPGFFTYVKKRNEFLIENNLSLGDYFYYYVLSYYSFLKKEISDGPPFNIIVSNSDGGTVVSFKEESEEEDREEILKGIKERRKFALLRKTNGLFIDFFENGFSGSDSAEFQIYYDELSKLKKNEFRLPWEEGLPVKDSTFFSKFNIEKTYNPMINSLEMELLTND